MLLTLAFLSSNVIASNPYDEEKKWDSSNDVVLQCKFDGPWYGQVVLDGGKSRKANWDLPSNPFSIKRNNNKIYASEISSSFREMGLRYTSYGKYVCSWNSMGDQQMCSGTGGYQMTFRSDGDRGLVIKVDGDFFDFDFEKKTGREIRIAYRKFTCEK